MTLPRWLQSTSAALGTALGRTARALGYGPTVTTWAVSLLRRLAPDHPALRPSLVPQRDAEPPHTPLSCAAAEEIRRPWR